MGSSATGPGRSELPLVARNALAEFLMEALAAIDRTVFQAAVSTFLEGGAGPSGTPEARLTSGLLGAGVAPGAPWWPQARGRLSRYREVLLQAPAGRDRASRLAQARWLFEATLFFEVHEVLEPAWMAAVGDEKRWLQGLIQAAVAWYHWESRNERGAASLATAACVKLEGAPALWDGLDVASVAAAAHAWRLWLDGGQGTAPPSYPGGRFADPLGSVPPPG